MPCGLSNCRTPHNRGCIVATKDKQKTNIGRDCGKTYFGVDFETLSDTFDRDITAKENREKLWAFFFRMPQFAEQVKSIRRAFASATSTHSSTSTTAVPP